MDAKREKCPGKMKKTVGQHSVSAPLGFQRGDWKGKDRISPFFPSTSLLAFTFQYLSVCLDGLGRRGGVVQRGKIFPLFFLRLRSFLL